MTQAQSAFGLASSFGLPLINGEDDTVYKTSPTRNLSDPAKISLSVGRHAEPARWNLELDHEHAAVVAHDAPASPRG